MHDVTLISFGYSHGPAPEGAILLADVRSVLYDPSVAASGLLDLDGRDPAIADIVERSPLARDLVGVAADMARDSTRLWCTIAIGCAGGRHRSVYLVERLARHFRPKYPQLLVRHNALPQ
jgi:UPF0042 nucleotide-binding protein